MTLPDPAERLAEWLAELDDSRMAIYDALLGLARVENEREGRRTARSR